jgi:hemerythrin-like domain-containing protein
LFAAPPIPATMRDLLEDLRCEHEDQRLALRLLLTITANGGSLGPQQATDCTFLMRYLREFVFGVHVVTETQTVLQGIVAHGDQAAVECAGEVLREIANARNLLHSLSFLWLPGGELDPEERQSLAAVAHALALVLQRCMQTEEEQLFVAAAAVPADTRLDWAAATAGADRSGRTAADWRCGLAAIAGRCT